MKDKKDKQDKLPALFEQMEPRLLFSADVEGTHAADQQPSPTDAYQQTVLEQSLDSDREVTRETPAAEVRIELVFVDTDTPEYQTLLSDLLTYPDDSTRYQVFELDNSRDGIAQITDILGGFENVNAIHILSHGTEGAIDLGGGTLDTDTLAANAELIGSWGSAFSADADILIYGCNLAANEAGQSLVNRLAGLTGADVAASEDLTGSAVFGGDWELEYTSGSVETPVAVGATAQAEFQAVLNTYNVSNTNATGNGSLYKAITDANANSGVQDTITFSIGGGGPQTIAVPAGGLPAITDSVILDATTQPGYSGTPLITLDGSGAGSVHGLQLAAGSDGSEVRGLAITNFNGVGILLISSHNHTITGNYVGTDGTLDLGNSSWGVEFQLSSGNTLGGNTAAERNVISGNGLGGLVIWGAASTGNTVTGNYIGTNAAGTGAIGNTTDGIAIGNGASSNTIGGSAAGEANVISGNIDDGIEIFDLGTNSNVIHGNYIGTTFDGSGDLGNGRHGLVIYNGAQSTQIGGSGAGQGNIISGNTATGIVIDGNNASDTHSNTIVNNIIGLNAAGDTAISNDAGGIHIFNTAGATTIGGNSAAERNIISGNTGAGILVESGSHDITITGNYIGTDISGTLGRGNTLEGVRIDGGANNVIGGVIAGQRNIISGNTDGVTVDSAVSGTVVQGNYIGTDASGTVAIGNTVSGVIVSGSSNTIGGTVAGAGNLISGNTNRGIYLVGATSVNNLVQGNLIGTDVTGNAALANGDGILIVSGASNNIIGGSVAGAGNLVSGNTEEGIEITHAGTSGNQVLGNRIGTNNAGTAALANGRHAVRILNDTDANIVGGAAANERNVIVASVGNIGVVLSQTDNNTVRGNYIGTDITGSVALGTGSYGVWIANGAAGNTVGGTNAGDRNVISAATTTGVRITGAGTDNNLVQGNYVGTDQLGTSAIANFVGVQVDAGAINNVIGGTSAAERNVISGNSNRGVVIHGSGTSGNRLEGNYIGLDATGNNGLGNSQAVRIHGGATGNYIGGTIAGAGNVISDSYGGPANGIEIFNLGTSGNYVQGNLIGTDASGTADLGNGWAGVSISDQASGNIIGGTSAAARNVLSGNSYGVQIYGSANNNIIQGNYIGSDINGTAAIGNNLGILMQIGAHSNLIGGTTAGADNLIAFNLQDGISLLADAGAGNTFLGNSIHDNTSLGIDLSNDNVTGNDLDDADPGPNDLLNYPEITSATITGTDLTLGGTLDTDGSHPQYHIEFFGNVAGTLDASNGEGRYYLGSTTVIPDGSGDGAFSNVTLTGVTISAGDYVTATATEIVDPAQVGLDDVLAYGSTSEFAVNIIVNNAPVAADDSYIIDEDSTLAADWFDTAWTARQSLTFDNSLQSETLVDFPVLVVLDSVNIDYTKTRATAPTCASSPPTGQRSTMTSKSGTRAETHLSG